MSRREFSAATKRAAWERSGGLCEGRGRLYGLKPRQRCDAPLSKGVVYDHVDPDANSKDNSLENCRCICWACNKFKTYKRDLPMIAKTVRQQNKHRDIRPRARRPVPGSRNTRFKRRMDGTVELR